MMAPRYFEPSTFATKMAVGPSAAPMIGDGSGVVQLKDEARREAG